MRDNKTRGYILIAAVGLLWYTLAKTTPSAWHAGHLLLLTVLASALTPIVLGWLRIIGLGRITDIALDAIGYHEQQQFNSSVLWNKVWVRSLPWWFAFFLIKKYTGWGTLVFVGYAAWAYYRSKQRSQSGPVQITPEELKSGFTFQTNVSPIWLANPYRGIFINGGPGSGKSKSIVEPIIQQAGAQALTGLVYDFKFPTLAQEVAGSYTGSAVTPYYVNFTDLNRSHRINPVAPYLLSSVSYAREAALTVLSNLDVKAAQQRSFWIQSAEVLLTGSIWYLRNNYPQYCTLPHAVSLLLESDPRQLIQVLQQDSEVRPIIASVSSGAGSENQLAGVFATVQNYLSSLVSPAIYWVLSGDDVPFELNNPQKPSILTVGNDPTLTATLSPLISLIVSTAIKRMNRPNQRPSVVILDEAPTLFIPNLQQLPATGRSNKIATVYAVQDISQMVGVFGRETSEMILGSLSNQFFGRSTTPEVADRVSNMFGRYDKEITTKSVSHSSAGQNHSKSQSIQQRDRIESQAVMRFAQGEFAGIIAEGSHTEFRRSFAPAVSRSTAIEPLNEVTEKDTRQQFDRINQEVKAVIQSVNIPSKNDPKESMITNNELAQSKKEVEPKVDKPTYTNPSTESKGETIEDWRSFM